MTFAVLLAVAGGVPVARAAAAPSERERACLSARPEQATRSPLLDPGQVLVPWSPRRSAALYAAQRVRIGGRDRVVLCLSRDEQPPTWRADGRGTLRVRDARLPVARSERVERVSIADPWIAWTTRTVGRADRRTVHWRRIDRPDLRPQRRTTRQAIVDLVATVDGAVAVSTVRDRRQRTILYRGSRWTRTLGPSVPVSRRDGSGAIVLWEPTAITVPGVEDPVGIDAWPGWLGGGSGRRTRLVDVGRDPAPRRCAGASATTVRSSRWSATITSSDRWTSALVLEGENLRQTLRLCRADGTPILATYGGESDGVGIDRLGAAALVGDIVLLRGYGAVATGTSGSGGGPTRALLEIAPDGTVRGHSTTPETVTAARHAVAWRTGEQVWLHDATGTRPVGTVPVATEATLTLTPASLAVVPSTGPSRSVPLHALPAAASAGPVETIVGTDCSSGSFTDVCAER